MTVLVCASCGERQARYIAVALSSETLFTPLCEECFRQAREAFGELMGEMAFRYVDLGEPDLVERLVELGNEEYRWRGTAHEKCLEKLELLKRQVGEGAGGGGGG